MFRIEMDEATLNSVLKAALDAGGRGVRLAMKIRAIRKTLDKLADGFNQVQQRAARIKPELMIADGQYESIRSALMPGDATFGWPSKSGRLLQSLDLANARRRGGMSSPDDYLCKLTIGPPQARQFGRYCAIFVYRHADNCGKIVWIGRESAFPGMLEAIAGEWSD